MLRAEDLRVWAHENSFTLRLAAFYVAVFFIIGCYMPFLPVWLRWRGLDDWEIALIYAVPMIMRPIFTPAMSFAADHSRRPIAFLKALAWGTLGAALTLPFTVGFWPIFTAFFAFTVLWMSIVPLTEAIALAATRSGRSDYGRVRLWGSIAFVAMTVLGGPAVKAWGPPAALTLFIGAALSVVVVVHWLPDPNGNRAGTASNGSSTLRTIRLADFMHLVRSRELWLFFAATSAVQSAHSVYYVFGTLHWQAIGISPTIIGVLWAVGVIAEIALFAYAARVLDYVGPVQLILAGGAAGVLRWTITAYDPPLAVLFPVQALHGLTYGAAHIGAMQFMHRAVPGEMAASVQGLYASVTGGLIMGLVSLSTGPLHRAFDGRAYLVMAAICAVSVATAWPLLRRWDGGLLTVR